MVEFHNAYQFIKPKQVERTVPPSNMPSHKDACFTREAEANNLLLKRTRAKLRQTTQKLRRTMMSTADWPSARVIFNSEMTTPADDGGNNSFTWLFPCCLQGCRSRSPEIEDNRNSNLSQMLTGAYKYGSQIKSKKLMLRTGADGSLICADNVDVNMLIEGFREFERRFQYGNLMPFANVLPSANSIRAGASREEIPEGREEEEEEESALPDSRKHKNKNEVFQGNQKKTIVVEGICEA